MIGHLLLRDLRAAWPRLLGVNLLVGLGAISPWLLLRQPSAPPLLLETVPTIIQGLAALGVLGMAVTITAADSPRRPDSFWRTRAIAPGHLLMAKWLQLAVGLVVLPGLVLALLGFSHGLAWSDHGSSVLRAIGLLAALVFLGHLAAGLWRSPVMGFVAMGIFAVLAAWVDLAGRFEAHNRADQFAFYFGGELRRARLIVAGSLGLAGLLGGVVCAYAGASSRRRRGCVALGLVAALTAAFFWPVTLPSLRYPKDVPLRPLTEAGRLDPNPVGQHAWLAFFPDLDRWGDEKRIRLKDVAHHSPRLVLDCRWMPLWYSWSKREEQRGGKNADYEFPAWIARTGVDAPNGIWRGRLYFTTARLETTRLPVTDGAVHRLGPVLARMWLWRRERDRIELRVTVLNARTGMQVRSPEFQNFPELVWDARPGSFQETFHGGDRGIGPLGDLEYREWEFRFITAEGGLWTEDEIATWQRSLRLVHTRYVEQETFACDAVVPITSAAR